MDNGGKLNAEQGVFQGLGYDERRVKDLLHRAKENLCVIKSYLSSYRDIGKKIKKSILLHKSTAYRLTDYPLTHECFSL